MKTIIFTLFVSSVACAHSDGARESRIVRTAQGPVRGYKNEGIFEFHGIPYATAPTGPKKFTAPLPGPVWTQPFEAVNNKIICPQLQGPWIAKLSMSMQENCLVANVFMPDINETNLPVLALIHGGGYQIGSGSILTPKTLVRSKKIVAVTFNYRLGAHGFLCLGTEDAPGNAGMKDQVALLRWVKKNIANFGGNPDDVTIAGGSAGAGSVDLHMLSEMSKDLFTKAIPESGSSITAWNTQQDPIQSAKDFAKDLNFTDVDDLNKLNEFYKSASYEELSSELYGDRRDSSLIFTPCVERKLNPDEETFIQDTPFTILKQGKFRKVPVLYGFDNMEGLLKLDRFNLWKEAMNERFEDFLPADLTFESENERQEVAKIIKQYYFGDKPVSEETGLRFIDYFSDMMIIYPILKTTELKVAAGNAPIYLYEYSFPSPIRDSSRLPDFAKDIKGATHCAQSVAVYDSPGPSDDSEAYKQIRRTLREIWLNFITTGKPVPEGSSLPAWPPADAGRSPYMELAQEIKLKDSLKDEMFHFWDGLYKKYHRTPIPPTRSRREQTLISMNCFLSVFVFYYESTITY